MRRKEIHSGTHGMRTQPLQPILGASTDVRAQSERVAREIARCMEAGSDLGAEGVGTRAVNCSSTELLDPISASNGTTPSPAGEV